MKLRLGFRTLAVVGAVGLAAPLVLINSADADPTTGAFGWGAWPYNSNGQVGRGTTDGSPTPTDVVGLGTDVRDVAAGGSHSLAVMDDGRVYAWGRQESGALGNGNTMGSPLGTPVPVVGLGAGSGVLAVAAGDAHSLALTSSGQVLAWGLNDHGQLGDGSVTSRSTPTPVVGLGSGVIGISAGSRHSLAVKVDGTVVSWGSNSVGQLGVTGTVDHTTPVPVVGLTAGSGVLQVSAGLSHSLARAADGTVYGWGSSGAPAGSPSGAQAVPTLGPGSGVIDIDGGGGFSVAAKSDGSMVGWGAGNYGRRCNGSAPYTDVPEVSDFGPGSGVVDVEAGWQSLLVRLTDGSVYGCGYDGNNELGTGVGGVNADGAIVVLHPIQLVGFGPGSGTTDIASGFAHGLAIASSPSVVPPPTPTSTATTATTLPPAPAYTASIGDITVSEGDTGTRTAAATISLDRVATTKQTVRVSSATGTAAAGDYVPFANKLVTIAAGKASQTVSITLNGDTASEGNESFRLLVSGSATVQAVNSNGRVTLLDDDAPSAHTPSMSVSDVTAYESDGMTTRVSFMVALSEPSAAPISARFSTVGFTAASGVDFTARTNVAISFPSM
ncbi:MAG: Calx-beta domain-containing protein [Acidimicrobiia bacterium]